MPYYEFKCSKGHTVSKILPAGRRNELFECPLCSRPLKRVHSGPVIHFKGKGFYSTDNADKRGDPSSTD